MTNDETMTNDEDGCSREPSRKGIALEGAQVGALRARKRAMKTDRCGRSAGSCASLWSAPVPWSFRIVPQVRSRWSRCKRDPLLLQLRKDAVYDGGAGDAMKDKTARCPRAGSNLRSALIFR